MYVEDWQERVQVRQGEFAVGQGSEICMTAILGSCVATALWDSDAGAGGLNHILLPTASADQRAGQTTSSTEAIRLAEHINSMEVLINGVLGLGARKSNLKAKVFGGAEMIPGLSSVGARNIEFVVRFLSDERIPIQNQSTGGTMGRTIEFWPGTGRARQRLLSDVQSVAPTKSAPARSKPNNQGPMGTDIELF